jgi:glycosyltransferase involved in cell wall biosynthesis
MTSQNPLVSIGMPVYNGSEVMSEAIDSLLAQTMPDLELIISDNASTDNTKEICLDYASRDRRVRYVRNEANIGAFANFDRVVQLARGKYFMWASHDDLWEPDFIRACLEPLETTNAILAYPNTLAFYTDREDRWTIAHDDIEQTLGTQSPVGRLAKVFRGSEFWVLFYGLMRTEIVQRVIPLPKARAPDMAFVALMALTGEFVHVPQVLFKFRGKERSTARYVSRGWLGPDIRQAKKFRNYWPTVWTICKRFRNMPMTCNEKIWASLETVRWCITEGNVIGPKKRKAVKRMCRGIYNRLRPKSAPATGQSSD